MCTLIITSLTHIIQAPLTLIYFDMFVCLGVDLVSCDLLREGAPIEPVPPVTHWKPDAVVREPNPLHYTGCGSEYMLFAYALYIII